MTCCPTNCGTDDPCLCKWPECDGNHARCAVLLACLGQVPRGFAGPVLQHDYRSGVGYLPEIRGVIAWSSLNGYDSWHTWPFATFAQSAAQQVADRLLAWLRWPGVPSSVRRRTEGQTFRLPWRGSVYSRHTGQSFELRDEAVLRIERMSPSDHFWRVVSMDRSGGDVLTVLACDVPNHAPVDRDGGATWHEAGEPVHPLDGTDVAGLRPCTTTRECYGCDGTGANTSLYEWQRDDDEIAEPMSEDCEECHGSGDGFDPDWPAVAVVADYLSSCGGWQWVHDFREPPDVKAIEARWEHAIDTGTLLNAQE